MKSSTGSHRRSRATTHAHVLSFSGRAGDVRAGLVRRSTELCGRRVCHSARRTLACVLSMNNKRLEERVRTAAEAALSEREFVTAIDIFLGLDWLAPSSEQAWRQGRTPYLERVVTANLSKISTAMRCLRVWAHRRGLKPSETAYVARSRGRAPLRFSKRGKPSIARA